MGNGNVQSYHSVTFLSAAPSSSHFSPAPALVLLTGCSNRLQCGLEFFQETPGSSGVAHTGRQIPTPIPIPLWSPPRAAVESLLQCLEQQLHFFLFLQPLCSLHRASLSLFASPVFWFFYSLKYFPRVFPETPLSWLRGSAVFCSKSTELTWSVSSMGQPWPFLTEAAPKATSLLIPTQQQNSYLSEDTQWL